MFKTLRCFVGCWFSRCKKLETDVQHRLTVLEHQYRNNLRVHANMALFEVSIQPKGIVGFLGGVRYFQIAAGLEPHGLWDERTAEAVWELLPDKRNLHPAWFDNERNRL